MSLGDTFKKNNNDLGPNEEQVLPKSPRRVNDIIRRMLRETFWMQIGQKQTSARLQELPKQKLVSKIQQLHLRSIWNDSNNNTET